MGDLGKGGARWRRVLAAALVLLAILGPVALGARPVRNGQGRPVNPAIPAARKAALRNQAAAALKREVARKALQAARKAARQKQAAANRERLARQAQQARQVQQAQQAREARQARLAREATAAPEEAPIPIDRPAKVITPPTLDSAKLDALIAKELAAAKLSPPGLANDEEFLRRVRLDLTGKLPTPEQVRDFALDPAPDKRATLIDALLADPDSARNWARYWRDVMRFRAPNPNQNQVRYDALEDWLSGELARNTPWDEIVTTLITATGPNDEAGAVNFAIAQMGQPVELAGEVSRIFMGVQIQCAQCHDHPTDIWKREQFHEFAAFFAGVKARRSNPKVQGPAVFEVFEQPRARYAMPDLKDPKKTIPVSARFFLDESARPAPERLSPTQRRALAASYVTGQDNPWFARAFVNRIWYALMGEAFYEPIDDLGPSRTPRAPEVLEELASQWQQGGYDIRWLLRTLLNTRAYQATGRPAGSSESPIPLASECPSRLRSDQILEALSQALGLPIIEGGRPGQLAKAGAKGAAARNQARGQGLPRLLFNREFGVDPSTPNEEVLGSIPQALFLMNGAPINRALRAANGTILGEVLAAHPGDDPGAIAALYLRVLARRPSADEVAACAEYLRSAPGRNEGFEDILWALVNSTEFVSRR